MRKHSMRLALSVVIALFGRAVFARDNIIVKKNLTYGKAGGVDLKLDIAYPKHGSGPFPGLICIHGGGWAYGERDAYLGLIEQAAGKGYVAVTISYRLTGLDPKSSAGKWSFPAQLHDCKCAVRWMRSVAGQYHIDPDRIGVTGHSAGGHLSLLVGLVDEKAGMEGDGGHSTQSSRVRAVANLSGPTDLARAYRDVKVLDEALRALCGGTPETATPSYRAASPVRYVSKGSPPVLTLHGEKDDLVPLSQAKLLDDAMKAAGAQHELVVLEGQAHGISGPVVDTAFWNFLEKHLKSN
jgi:acetyl esterase/lipase